AADIPSQTLTTYNGMEWPTAQILRAHGNEKWRTTTTYAGDRTHVDPPDGATAATAITDAREQIVALRQYRGASPTGPYDETRYDYWPDGQLKTVTDPALNIWSYSYDLRGRLTGTVDPDRGASSIAYDALDQVVGVTDSRNRSTSYEYDALGRRTKVHDGALTGPVTTQWTYDTIAKGKATSSSRFFGGGEYKTEITAYDEAYRPTGSKVTIPQTALTPLGLSGTYTTNLTYNVDGSVKTVQQPTAAGLPPETLTLAYDPLGMAKTVTGVGAYVAGTTYSPYGDTLQLTLGNTVGKSIWQTFFYEEGTRRLERSTVDRESVPTSDADVRYTYDAAGNVKKVADLVSADTQCFLYDHLRRVTEEWTATDDCAGAPSLSVLGGPAPYWHTFGYDVTGNRTSEVRHSSVGNTTRTYTYPAPGTAQPHALTSVTTTPPSGPASTESFTYDTAGNLKTRSSAPAETLDWDSEGGLESVTGAAGGDITFLDDAYGTRLVRKDASGTTLYLDNTEIRLTASGVSSTRYYTHNGRTVAVRAGSDVETLVNDHHGTASMSIDNVTAAVTSRRFTPFGEARGSASGTWVGERSFVGGTSDPTGFVHLGAREYDPANGRFVSVDPVIDPADPQQMNGYAYSGNNPVTFSDPDGLLYDGEGGGGKSTPAPKPASSSSQTKYAKNGAGQARAHEQLLDDEKPLTVQQRAQIDVEVARARHEGAKEKIKNVVGTLLKIAADELGITAAVNCFTQGDLGACGEVALNIVMSLAGGIAGKMLKKYGFPWKWKKGAKLVKKVWDLASEAISALRGLSRFEHELEFATKHADEVLSHVDDAASHVDEAVDGARCLLPNSFTGATPVLLADGTSKPIEDVDVGDLVVATDPRAGVTDVRAVTALMAHGGLHTMVDLALSDGTTIVATDHHPFWNARSGRYVHAVNLLPGARVRTASGSLLTVERTRVHVEDLVAYNLSVDGLHTFYAGATPVLVHNCSTADPSSFSGATRAEAEDALQKEGWQSAGDSHHGGGIKYRKPGNNADQVRIMPGKATDPNPIK
ncbi:MAG: hypothetical protein QOE05_2273, partial [Actinomycetota bacterium]|nr:hypothetical protein [Actinomycetota bacterium]